MNTPTINPTILSNLIEFLKLKYPDSLPANVTTLEGIHIKIGNKQVITTLEQLLELELRG